MLTVMEATGGTGRGRVVAVLALIGLMGIGPGCTRGDVTRLAHQRRRPATTPRLPPNRLRRRILRWVRTRSMWAAYDDAGLTSKPGPSGAGKIRGRRCAESLEKRPGIRSSRRAGRTGRSHCESVDPVPHARGRADAGKSPRLRGYLRRDQGESDSEWHSVYRLTRRAPTGQRHREHGRRELEGDVLWGTGGRLVLRLRLRPAAGVIPAAFCLVLLVAASPAQADKWKPVDCGITPDVPECSISGVLDLDEPP